MGFYDTIFSRRVVVKLFFLISVILSQAGELEMECESSEDDTPRQEMCKSYLNRS